MRHIMLCLTLILCLVNAKQTAYAVSANATQSQDMIDSGKKHYVDIEQISFANQKIYIMFDEMIYETPALFSDEEGYYIVNVARSGDCSWYEWQCRKCKSCNLRGVDWECRACGHPISK